MDIKILIAMHKPYPVPNDRCYVPMQVGAAGKATFCECRDDSGNNISAKNPNFCELTALYWAWQNMDADAIGLVHYRRYFTAKDKGYIKSHRPFDSVLTDAEVEALMQRAHIVVPKKRRYYIESLYSHYANTHDGSHLDIARSIVADRFPDLLPYVDEAYRSTYGYMFNMCIMKWEYLDDYCRFIFNVLFEMEKQIDTTGMTRFDARLFGRVSEILFTAWIFKAIEDGIPVEEVAVMDMEPVDWKAKIMRFLAAKFLKKKYRKSQ